MVEVRSLDGVPHAREHSAPRNRQSAAPTPGAAAQTQNTHFGEALRGLPAID